MKFNLAKAATYYRTTIDGVTYRYGWYKSGKAFIAKDDELMTYMEAAGKFMPKGNFNSGKRFYSIELGQYFRKTIDGIVRYLIIKYNI